MATIFPPKNQTLIKINKTVINFIWGATREVTKREVLYKSKKEGGLGAVDLGLKLEITFCKNIASGIKRNAVWVGEVLSWTKKRGRARQSVLYFKLVYSDFITSVENHNINWCDTSSKQIYSRISDSMYGGTSPYKHLDTSDYDQCIKNIFNKNLPENKRDHVANLSGQTGSPGSCQMELLCYNKDVPI